MSDQDNLQVGRNLKNTHIFGLKKVKIQGDLRVDWWEVTGGN